ncbi:MAG: leucine-rich repeat protein [Rikenellaceae bacterium]
MITKQTAKQTFRLILVAFAAIFMACQETTVVPEPDPEPDPDPEVTGDTIVSAVMLLSVEDFEGMDYFDWSEAISVSVFVPGVSDNANREFSGDILDGGSLLSGDVMTWEGEKTLYAVYPYSSEGYEFDAESEAVKIMAQSEGSLDLEVGFSRSDMAMIGAVSGATADPDKGYSSSALYFKNVFSCFEMTLQGVPSSETIVSFGLESPLDVFVSEAYVVCASGEIVGGGQEKVESLSAMVEGGGVESATLRMSLFPCDATLDSVVVLVVTRSDDAQSEDDLNIYSIIIPEGLEFRRGELLSLCDVVKGGEPLNLVEDFEEITATPVIPPVEESLSLEDISKDNIPEEDMWVIVDEVAITSDFYGVREALNALATSGRKISIEMPNLKDIPHGAIMGENKLSDDYTVALLESDAESVAAVRAERMNVEASVVRSRGDVDILPMPLSPLSRVSSPYKTVEDIDVKDYALADNYSMAALVSFVAEKAVSTGHYSFFRCSGLEEVSIPEAQYVGQQTFDGCVSLEEVSFPEATIIYDWAFELSTALKKVSFAKAQIVQYAAFKGCTALSEVYFPEAVTLESYVFSTCSSLSTVSFPVAEVVGGYCFYNCTKLKSIDFPKVKKINNFSFMACELLESVSLPEVTFLGMQALGFCTSMTEVSIPKADTLFQAVFYGSPAFSTLEIPSIEYIGGGTFYGCSSLTDLELNSSYYVEEDGVVYNSAKTKLVAYLSSREEESYSAPSSVSSLELYAFGGSGYLRDVTLESVSDLYYMAFDGCTALESVVAVKARTIRMWLFNNCPNLTSLEIASYSGTSLYAIESGAFTTDAVGNPVNENVALTIGTSSSSYVSDNVLTYGDNSYTFKSITLK